MKMTRLVYVVLASAVGSSFAQSSQQCKDKPILAQPGCYLGGATKTERSSYNEAKKELKEATKAVQQQTKKTEEACTPLRSVFNPIAVGQNIVEGRTPFESKECVQEKDRLDSYENRQSGAQKDVQIKKDAYDSKKKATGALW